MLIEHLSRSDDYLLRLIYSPLTGWLFIPLTELFLGMMGPAERRLFFAGHLIMLRLHSGQYEKARRLEDRIQDDPEMRTVQLFVLGDFIPSGFEHSGRCFRIVVDSRVRSLSEFLLADIEDAERWLEENLPGNDSTTTFFFMDGSGPSPFNPQLGDVYLKVGHYMERQNDRELVTHALVHEATHMYLRNHLGFRICSSDSGVRKFFDEGFAQLCGFRAAGALERKMAHADTCASSVIAGGWMNLRERIDDWLGTVLRMKHLPLYQAALSFMGFLEERTGFDALIEVFRNADCECGFSAIIEERTGSSLPDLLKAWSDRLTANRIGGDDDFFRITGMERTAPDSLVVHYSSDHPLYPTRDVMVLDENGRQLPVITTGKYRYREKGSFVVECPPRTLLSLTAVFDDLSVNTAIDECGI